MSSKEGIALSHYSGRRYTSQRRPLDKPEDVVNASIPGGLADTGSFYGGRSEPRFMHVSVDKLRSAKYYTDLLPNLPRNHQPGPAGISMAEMIAVHL